MDRENLCAIIPVAPIAKQRPRFSKFGTYDKQKSIKEMYRLLLLPQLPKGFKVIDGPIELNVVFELPIVKGTSKKRTKLLVGTPHLKKPDIDNLYKMFDAFTGILWIDDNQIYKVSMEKIYSLTPRTVINITYAKA